MPDSLQQRDRAAAGRPAFDLRRVAGVRLLEIPQAGHVAGQQALLVDQPHLCRRLGGGGPVADHGVAELVGDAHASGAGPEYQQLLVPHRDAGDLDRGQRSGEGDRAGALHVVVEDPVLLAVGDQDPPRIAGAEVLKMQQRAREQR